MNEQQLPPLPKPAIANGPGSMFRFNYYTAEQMRDYARAVLAMSPKLASGTSLAANEKVPSRATDIATALALPGCERLREWAEIGPVQRAAVEEFAYALAANVPQTVYQLSPTDIYDFAGWLTTRKVSMQVGSSHEAAQMAEAVGEYLKTYPERFAAAPAPEADTNEPLFTAEEVHAYCKRAREEERAELLAAPAQAQQSSERLRERFERWALAQGWNVERRDVGDYQTLSTDAAWGAWIGCTADAEDHHSKLCAEWSSICRSSRRHGAALGIAASKGGAE